MTLSSRFLTSDYTWSGLEAAQTWKESGIRTERETLQVSAGAGAADTAEPARPAAPAREPYSTHAAAARGELILEGILFIQEIFLEIFTCQDYTFKFFDEASSGSRATFLNSFASLSSSFPAHKRLLQYHHPGGTNRSSL